jgi:hypothetical protein
LLAANTQDRLPVRNGVSQVGAAFRNGLLALSKDVNIITVSDVYQRIEVVQVNLFLSDADRFTTVVGGEEYIIIFLVNRRRYNER